MTHGGIRRGRSIIAAAAWSCWLLVVISGASPPHEILGSGTVVLAIDGSEIYVDSHIARAGDVKYPMHHTIQREAATERNDISDYKIIFSFSVDRMAAGGRYQDKM